MSLEFFLNFCKTNKSVFPPEIVSMELELTNSVAINKMGFRELLFPLIEQ